MLTIDQILAEKISSSLQFGDWPIGNLLLCVIAMLLSVILCGAIGIERELRGRSAGLRTHLLVGVGSCMIMIISIYGFPKIVHDGNLYNRDVARLAAQVIAGVGFLGAGAIIHRNSGTKGLTTAATIWIVMAIGLACGSMNFILATGGTILILVFLIVFKKVETRLNKKSPLVVVNAKRNYPVASCVSEIAKNTSCYISDLQIEVTEDETVEITFLVSSPKKDFDILEFVTKLEEVEGVNSVVLPHAQKI